MGGVGIEALSETADPLVPDLGKWLWDQLDRPGFHVGRITWSHGCPGSRLLLIVLLEDFQWRTPLALEGAMQSMSVVPADVDDESEFQL